MKVDPWQAREVYNADRTYVRNLFSEIWKMSSKLNRCPIRLIKELLQSKPIKFFFKLPWTMLSKIPGLLVVAQRIQNLLFPQNDEDKKPDDDSSHATNDMHKPPLVEEITVPSVTELYKSKVRFQPTVGNISTVRFDTKTATFNLPTISLDVNTEVILKKLVAYEASYASGPLAFARYTELINGIIDTEEDFKLLREKGIILKRLKTDTEVANIWNRMSKSVRLTKVPHIDKVIEDVNKYYHSRWKVKVCKNTKLYVFSSWKFLTFLATIILLLLTTLQALS